MEAVDPATEVFLGLQEDNGTFHLGQAKVRPELPCELTIQLVTASKLWARQDGCPYKDGCDICVVYGMHILVPGQRGRSH